MKLQLTARDVSSVASKCEALTGNLEQDTRRVLHHLAVAGHRTITRKDVTAVLVHNGVTEGVKNGILHGHPWKVVGSVLKELRKDPSLRGLYHLEPVKPSETATQRWLSEQIRTSALDRKVAALLKRTFKHEEFEDLLSFVGLWFAKWGNAGTCDSYIESGKPPTLSILTVWVSQKLSHRLNRDAQDALRRETKGVRTQLEIRVRKETDASDYILEDALRTNPHTPKVAWNKGGSNPSDRLPEFVAPEIDMTSVFEQEELELARDIVRVRRKRAAERYARFFDHLMGGRSREEAAALEGVSRLRVTHLYQRVRDDLRQAPDLIQVALKVLAAISAEPFSTVAEIEEDIRPPSQENLNQALQLLVMRGFATEGSGSSFAPTNAGRNALTQRSLM